MDTLLTIQDRLRQIATNADITGPAVEGLVLLLSESIYRGQLGNVTELLERSFSRCRLLNSAITHSFDRCYSVFRGKNQSFKIVNALPIESMSVKQFDVAVEANMYKLVFAKDYNFVSLVDPGEVELILCADVITQTETVSESDKIKINFDYQDISESISVARDYLGESTNVDFTNIFADAVKGHQNIDGSVTFPLWVGTRPNFGISIVNASPSTFTPNERVRVKYLKYTDAQVEVSQIPSLPGFVSTIENIDNNGIVINQDSQLTVSNYQSIAPVPRTTNLSEIFKNANSAFLTGGVIKSYNDLESIINEYYGEVIGDINIRFDFTTSNGNPFIFVTYADKDPLAPLKTYAKLDGVVKEFDIDGGQTGSDLEKPFTIEAFNEKARNAYYIEEKIIFIPAQERVLPNLGDLNKYCPGVEWSDDDQGRFKVKIYYTSLEYPSDGVNEVLKNYRCTFYKKLNLSRLIAELQEVDGVKFVELFVQHIDENDVVQNEVEFPSVTIELPNKDLTILADGNTIKTDLTVPVKTIQKTEFDIEFIAFDKYLKENN